MFKKFFVVFLVFITLFSFTACGGQGEKGEKGDTGAQGPQGVQGPQGPAGDSGLSDTLKIYKLGETAKVYSNGMLVMSIKYDSKNTTANFKITNQGFPPMALSDILSIRLSNLSLTLSSNVTPPGTTMALNVEKDFSCTTTDGYLFFTSKDNYLTFAVFEV